MSDRAGTVQDRRVSHRPARRQSRVPTTRLGRMLRLGITAGELAAGGLVESVRRLGGQAKADRVSAFLSEANATRLAKRLAHMRGAAMKLGQLMSLESEHVLPAEFTDALAMLRDSADRMTTAQLNRLMGREYGKGWQTRFKTFDYEPVAAASIGQVHFAETLDGRELALKIQYPGVAKSINSDVNNMASLLRMAQILPVEMDISGIVAEAKRQLAQEADYLMEADYLRRYREFVADEQHFRVPAVHDDLTTRRILAMDFMDGQPLESLAREQVTQQVRDQVGALLYRLLFRELFEFRLMQTDPNFGNYLLHESSGDIVLLDFGSTVEYTTTFTRRYAQICRAMVAGNRAAVRGIAAEIGYLHAGDSERHVSQVLDLISLVCEPLISAGTYDFGTSDLILRARDAGLDLVFRSGEFRAPPPETIFLHRKLVGSFMLCARIRARIDVRSLIEPFLD